MWYVDLHFFSVVGGAAVVLLVRVEFDMFKEWAVDGKDHGMVSQPVLD